jgi:pilus assembly protein CpaF
MMLMAGVNLPERALREQISSALNVIVQLSRLSDGARKLVEL